jgi:hypothetical protein
MSCKSIIKNSIGIAFGFLILVLIAGCVTKPAVVKEKEDEKQILKKRALEYWNLMINVNPRIAENLYQFEAPALRERVPFAEYINRFKTVKYFDAEVGTVDIDGEKASVTVTTTSLTALPRPAQKLKSRDSDRWVKVGGAWYHWPREWAVQE